MMETIEEESKKELNLISNSNINNGLLDDMNIDFPSTEQTPSHNSGDGKFLFNENVISQSKTFIFKPYLSPNSESKFDENLNLENKIKELHQLKTDYLNYQPNLSSKKRYILFDWIMEVSSQFHFKRKTYYSCINLIEIYFSKITVNTEQIQLIGITCLLISAKNEEILIPQLSYFTKACDNLYSKSEILNQEIIILNALNWKIQYKDLCDLGNLLTYEWDCIINELNKNFNNKDKFPVFRNDPEFKDLLLNRYFQILDYISLDYFYNFVHEKYICICVMYIIIGVAKKAFEYKDAFEFFNNIKPSNYEKVRIYQRFFFNLSKHYFKISMVEILDVMKYVCMFSGIEFEPLHENALDCSSYEEKNQLQIYNRNNYNNFLKLKESRENNNLNV